MGQLRITCEVNLRPPNPLRDAFRAELGFTEVGRGTSGDGPKSVRYRLRQI
jgi:predicted GNAT superfamily acetyltransferase